MGITFFNALLSLAIGLFLIGLFGMICFVLFDEIFTEDHVDWVFLSVFVAVWIGVSYGIFISI